MGTPKIDLRAFYGPLLTCSVFRLFSYGSRLVTLSVVFFWRYGVKEKPREKSRGFSLHVFQAMCYDLVPLSLMSNIHAWIFCGAEYSVCHLVCYHGVRVVLSCRTNSVNFGDCYGEKKARGKS